MCAVYKDGSCIWAVLCSVGLGSSNFAISSSLDRVERGSDEMMIKGDVNIMKTVDQLDFMTEGQCDAVNSLLLGVGKGKTTSD